jgi:hypothetical protein
VNIRNFYVLVILSSTHITLITRVVIYGAAVERDWLRAAQPRGQSSNPGRVKNFHFSISFRLASGSTQPLIQWKQGALFPGSVCRGVKLTTHLQLYLSTGTTLPFVLRVVCVWHAVD